MFCLCLPPPQHIYNGGGLRPPARVVDSIICAGEVANISKTNTNMHQISILGNFLHFSLAESRNWSGATRVGPSGRSRYKSATIQPIQLAEDTNLQDYRTTSHLTAHIQAGKYQITRIHDCKELQEYRIAEIRGVLFAAWIILKGLAYIMYTYYDIKDIYMRT